MLLYRALWILLTPLLAAGFALRVLRGRETRGDLAQRLGPGRAPRHRRPTVWVHAASNGELASARPVIEALRAARPDLGLLVTCNTPTGRAMARDWGLEARLAPIDLRWIARRLIRTHDIRALVTLEAELWPNRHAAAEAAQLPVILLGARLSARTAAGWARFPGLARRLVRAIALASPQDAGSATRLEGLGLDPARIGPVVAMKALYRPADLPPEPALVADFDRTATWLAASTHPGEEEVVIAAHLRAREHRPDLRLILAPRHPRRGPEIAQMLAGAGLACDRRSAGGLTGAPVLLADTMGEMDRWYALAGTVFVGGSLVARGGHTPYEPMVHRCALLHGPDVTNFAAAYSALDAAGGAQEVRDAETLAAALRTLSTREAQEAAARHTALALNPEAGLDDLVGRIVALLPPPDRSRSRGLQKA